MWLRQLSRRVGGRRAGGLRAGRAIVSFCAPLALVISLSLKPAVADDAPTRSERVAWGDAVRALALTEDQLLQLKAARAEHGARLIELQTQASALPKREAGLKAADRICQHAQELEAAFRRQVAALMLPEQARTLEAWRQAFLLLPQIESAQAAGLLEQRQALPPAGLPQGSATVLVRWQRMPASALPGCPTTRVLREVDQGDASPARKTPP